MPGTRLINLSKDRLSTAVAELDAGGWALLDLSLHRSIQDDQIANVLRSHPAEIASRREALLAEIADELGVAGADRLELVRVALAELPAKTWDGIGRGREGRFERQRVPRDVQPPAALDQSWVDAPPAPAPRPRWRRRHRRAAAWIALALLLLSPVAAFVALQDRSDTPSNTQRAPLSGDTGPDPIDEGIRLQPVAANLAADGTARILGRGRAARLSLSVGVPARGRRASYEVWLFNSVDDAVRVGSFRGSATAGEFRFPADPADYQLLDISLEPADGNRNHSGRSVLRAPISELLGSR